MQRRQGALAPPSWRRQKFHDKNVILYYREIFCCLCYHLKERENGVWLFFLGLDRNAVTLLFVH